MIEKQRSERISPLQLCDGRRVDVLEVGDRDGFPIFHFHGNGTSALEVLLVEAVAQRHGIRLIGLSRPGIGGSDARPGYRLLDWPDDVAEVADQLGIERFAVEGLSGGGPYALACASKIAPRLTGCGLISTATGSFASQFAPPSMRAALWLLTHQPRLMQALLRLGATFQGSDEASIEKRLLRNRKRLGTADHQLLDIPQIRTSFARAIADGSRQGADTPAKDGLIFVGPWGFRPEEISFEKVYLWQGEQDRVMSAVAARRLSQALPHCTATFYPEEGHLSTFVNHVQEIWKALQS